MIDREARSKRAICGASTVEGFVGARLQRSGAPAVKAVRDMKPGTFSITRRATGAGAALMAAAVSAHAAAADLVGQPTDGAIDFQPGVTKLRLDAMWFHTWILLPVLFGISLLVLGLLLWCIIRFNAKANPKPARFTHNTTVEVLWTIGPVLILLFIAIFSFRLLFEYHDMPKPDLTVKAIGYQWYWGYTYPDQKIDEYTSNILPEAKAKAAGVPYMLASTAPMVVPVGKVVHVLVQRRRRDPLVLGAGVRHQDRRRARPHQRHLVQDRPRRHLLRPVLAALRHRPQLHADRGEGGQPGRLRRLGGVQGPADRPARQQFHRSGARDERRPA